MCTGTLEATGLEREVTWARWTLGAVLAGVGGVDVVVFAEGEAPPVLAARAADVLEPVAIRLQNNAPTVRTCKTANLFRGPAGLADGLALKEPALPTVPTVGFAPTTWVPRSLTPGQGLGVRRHAS